MAAPKPIWFQQLLALKLDIDSKDWVALRDNSQIAIKALYAEAPTVKKPVETILLSIMQKGVDPEVEVKINILYKKALTLAAIELDTTTFDRIIKEEDYSEQLDKIYNNIHKSWRKVWNYWRGEQASDFVKWAKLKEAIETTPLTRIGRFRLLARHAVIGKRIMPSFLVMAVQLWPIAALWVAKKLGAVLVSKTVSAGLEKRKARKKLQDLSSKLKSSKLGLTSLKKSNGT